MASAPDLNQPNLRPPSDVNPRSEPALDFPDREFGEMSAADYDTIGFMSGIEVHQQLATTKKLFCRCPSGHFVDHFDAEVLRHMRPTLSELGEYDGCALMEFKTRKEIVYQLERGTVCTYEIDDTPPFEINMQAVEYALELGELFELNPVSELHVMRKQYLDGSIPTGFQRTAMVGLGGQIPFVEPSLGIDRTLNIRQLSLEEDSCREISDVGHRITFRTDRLGMPLTEVVTEPEMFTPFELQAGARLVARTTRAGGRVRRGAGAARQDVNVSVAGGRRTEIKGVCHHRGLPQLVHIEGFRQLNLLRVRAELLRRGVTTKLLDAPADGDPVESSTNVLDATGILSHSDFAPLRDCFDRGEKVAAVRLPGFAGLLVHRTQPGVTFANEFADRVRVIACLSSRPFMIHSDIEGCGLSHAQWQSLRKAVSAKNGDAVIVLWGPERDLVTAVREVFLRALDALIGVPAETRQGFPDGTTGFERILPGADRMYPDTDTPPIRIPDEMMERVQARECERPGEKEARFVELGLDASCARRLVDAPWCALFEELSPPAGALANRVAYALEKRIPHWWRVHKLDGMPESHTLRPWIEAMESGRVRLEACERVLDLMLRDSASLESILDHFSPNADDATLLETVAAELLQDLGELREDAESPAVRWAMGHMMPSLVGRIAPEDVRVRAKRAMGLGGAR